MLWLDERSYFSERWRLLSPEDALWGRFREWGMAGALKRTLTMGSLRYRADLQGHITDHFWCPFADDLIDDTSRMAVSRYVVAVTGKRPPPNARMELYTIALNWGGMDRTWRFRLMPSDAAVLLDTPPEGGTIRLQRLVLRDDLTLCVPGQKAFLRIGSGPDTPRLILHGW